MGYHGRLGQPLLDDGPAVRCWSMGTVRAISGERPCFSGPPSGLLESNFKVRKRQRILQSLKLITKDRTALAEAELEYNDNHESLAAYISITMSGNEMQAFFGMSSAVHLIIWTTQPWTMAANKAVAVNPDLWGTSSHCRWVRLRDGIVNDWGSWERVGMGRGCWHMRMCFIWVIYREGRHLQSVLSVLITLNQESDDPNDAISGLSFYHFPLIHDIPTFKTEYRARPDNLKISQIG